MGESRVHFLLLLTCIFGPQDEQKIAELKKENQLLKRHIQQLEKEIQLARDAGFLYTDENQVHGLRKLFRNLPDELDLKKKKPFWTNAQVRKANKWLNEELSDKQFAIRPVLSNYIAKKRSDGRYGIQLHLQPETFSVAGHQFIQQFGETINYRHYNFIVDQETHERLQRLKKNRSYPLIAKINSISLHQNIIVLRFDRVRLNSIAIGF